MTKEMFMWVLLASGAIIIYAMYYLFWLQNIVGKKRLSGLKILATLSLVPLSILMFLFQHKLTSSLGENLFFTYAMGFSNLYLLLFGFFIRSNIKRLIDNNDV